MNKQFLRQTMVLGGLFLMTWGVVGSAQAKDKHPYVAFSLGVNDLSTVKTSLGATLEANKGLRISAAAGYAIGEHVRAEVELFREKNTADTLAISDVSGGLPQTASGNITTTGLMANGYYDFKTKMAVVPYIGIGLGFAKVTAKNVTAAGFVGTNDSDRVLAWQLKAGVSYAVTDATDLTFGYRFFDTQDLSLVTTAGTPYTSDGARSHSLEIGIRYGF